MKCLNRENVLDKLVFLRKKCFCDDCVKIVNMSKEEKLNDIENSKNTFIKCEICEKDLDLLHFTIFKRKCDDCVKKLKEDAKKQRHEKCKIYLDGLKLCTSCNQKKRIPDQIYHASDTCYDCEQKQNKNNTSDIPSKMNNHNDKTEIIQEYEKPEIIHEVKQRLDGIRCHSCKEVLPEVDFNVYYDICDVCAEKIKQQRELRKQLNKSVGEGNKVCDHCKEVKKVPSEIYFGSLNCYECEKIIEQEKKSELEKETCKHTCKDCGLEFEVNKHKTWFICDDCKAKREQLRLYENSKPTCSSCNEVFDKDPHSRYKVCPKCREKYMTKCVKCGEEYDRAENFKINKFTCDECSIKIQQQERHDKDYRMCDCCNEDKIIGVQIAYKGFHCFNCEENKRRQRCEQKRKK
jgi:hypothetical protein